MEIQFIRNKNFILRGSRCHGIPMENTKLLFIRGLRSWPEIKMRRHLKKTLNELNDKVLSVKRIANFNDAFFKIKIVGNEEELTSITDCIVNSFKRASINVINCSKRNHKYSFSSLKRKHFALSEKVNSSYNINLFTTSNSNADSSQNSNSSSNTDSCSSSSTSSSSSSSTSLNLVLKIFYNFHMNHK